MRAASATRSTSAGSVGRSGASGRSSVRSFEDPGLRPVSPWLLLERAAGVVEVDVVEGRPRDGGRLDLDSGLLQGREDDGDCTGSGLGSGTEDAALVGDVVQRWDARKPLCGKGSGRVVGDL